MGSKEPHSYTVVELKQALRKRGLLTSGTKAELIARLSKQNEQIWQSLNEEIHQAAENMQHAEQSENGQDEVILDGRDSAASPYGQTENNDIDNDRYIETRRNVTRYMDNARASDSGYDLLTREIDLLRREKELLERELRFSEKRRTACESLNVTTRNVQLFHCQVLGSEL